MPFSTEPCEKHELTNCSFCTGQDRNFQASLDEPELDRGLLPKIPGGPTIHANFPGTCAGCGRRYPKGEPIHHNTQDFDGWVGVSVLRLMEGYARWAMAEISWAWYQLMWPRFCMQCDRPLWRWEAQHDHHPYGYWS